MNEEVRRAAEIAAKNLTTAELQVGGELVRKTVLQPKHHDEIVFDALEACGFCQRCDPKTWFAARDELAKKLEFRPARWVVK